ncbi:MAG: bis(5'-nucleosyl)-tetraphosphatase (symmetrical) YqeK [Bacillota bacterium]
MSAANEDLRLAWSIARRYLSGRRLLHTEGTVRAALALAGAFGADPQKAAVAAVLHDIVRDETPAELVRLARAKGIMVRTEDEKSPVLLHGRVAAVIAREQGVTDPCILAAVESHVTGRAGWTGLEQTLYLADKIEETRDYPGVQELRELAGRGRVREALKEALKNAIKHSLDARSSFVDPETVVVFNEVSQNLAQAPER